MKAIATFSRLRQRAIPRQQALFAGLAIVGLWLLVACLAPWIAPFDPIAQDASSSLLPPGGAHLFGTDNFGRDVFFPRAVGGAGRSANLPAGGPVPLYARHHPGGAGGLYRRRGRCAGDAGY
ncbi:dipeptide transport system permease DppC [Klebsiella michiganensis]|nr:dipeptide transport system permease DppC [Klebsiella michiganensis]